MQLSTPACASLLLVLALALPAAAVASPSAIFVLTDPTRDDYGDGTLNYPLVSDMREGDLDLVGLSAEAASDGTWFEVTMRREIRPPGHQVIDSLGRTKSQIAKLGFWEFNVDIYVDTDRIEGSGQTSTLPGRKLTIDPKTAWEKFIGLSPQPEQSALIVRSLLAREAKSEARENKARVDDSDLVKAKESAYHALESDFWFARSVQVIGRRVKFFVPAALLGGTAKPEWAYTVVVTGATLEPRFDSAAMIGKSGLEDDFLLIPVGTGLSASHFAGREDDPLQSPAVDVIVPDGQKQEELLRDYDLRTGRMATLTGVVPAASAKKE